MYLGTTVTNARWAPLGLLFALSASAQLLTAATAVATEMPTSQQTFTHLVEWDIPITGDSEPGAIAGDTRGKDQNRVWFLTRNPGPDSQKVYRFDAAKSLMKGPAQWTSWQLSLTLPATNTGGLKRLKPSDDRRYVFVRTSDNLQRVDTQNCKAGSPQTCELTVWQDQPGNLNV